jgi:hypothetical protein
LSVYAPGGRSTGSPSSRICCCGAIARAAGAFGETKRSLAFLPFQRSLRWRVGSKLTPFGLVSSRDRKYRPCSGPEDVLRKVIAKVPGALPLT